VLLIGNVPHERVPEYLGGSDCLVASHLYENYEWGLVEYLAVGKPIVATNVGGTGDVIKHGYNGLLCECNPISLAQQMKNIIKDSDLRSELGKNALITARNRHGMDNLWKYIDILHNLGT